MGANHSIHIANDSGQDIYVMASLNPDWAVVDSIADMGVKLLLGAAAGNLHAATTIATATKLPKNIRSLRDIFSCLEAARQLLSKTRGAVGNNKNSAGIAMVDSFKRGAIHIPAGQFRNVCERDVLGLSLSVDGIASLMGARNICLVVMSGDGGRVAMWNSNSDHSWVCRSDDGGAGGEIRRSKYGTVWQVDGKGRCVKWRSA
ncbi:hypothetical protein QBC43DRAFT_246079 [Cladorrhinum sp. PSN259]|nr:hypothetical protein QBC43DRAFT_246079 [Cladorrhinum sp. PSN259]